MEFNNLPKINNWRNISLFNFGIRTIFALDTSIFFIFETKRKELMKLKAIRLESKNFYAIDLGVDIEWDSEVFTEPHFMKFCKGYGGICRDTHNSEAHLRVAARGHRACFVKLLQRRQATGHAASNLTDRRIEIECPAPESSLTNSLFIHSFFFYS